MIFLKQDISNTVVLTLQEKTTITGQTPYYLFEFTNDDTNESKVFTASDLSTCTRRYNEFIITLTGGTESLTGGTITLSPNGYWKYNIYQMTGQTNLNISNTISMVENGKVYVSGTTLPVITEYTGETPTKYVYNG